LLMENTSASATNRLTNIDLKENGSLVGSFGHQSVSGPFGDGAAGGYFAARAGGEGFSILAGGVLSANVAMRILSDGKVGIGTTSPSEKLSISGNTNSYTALQISNGAAGGRSYGFASTDNTNGNGGGKFGIFDFTTGAYRMMIDNAGNVGIGTVSPGAQLQVNSSAVGTIGEIIKGAASQSADLLQAQNSSSSVLAQITSDGTIKSSVGVYVGNDQLSSVLQAQIFS